MLRDIFDWLATHPTGNVTANTGIWLAVIALGAVVVGGWIGKSR